jgi:uncharacterized protein
MNVIRTLGFIWLLICATMASAQTLPALTGRVVDQASLLSPAEESAISAKLEALEQATTRQLAVVTVPDLQGHPVEDFGFRLGEAWKLGNKEADNGAILLIAKAEHRIRIEVGDGLEPILPDAMAWIIIRDSMTPRFKANDYAGGINAGVDAIIQQLQAPPEQAEARVRAAAQARQAQRSRSNGGNGIPVPFIFFGIILFTLFLSMTRKYRRHGAYRGKGFGGSALPIILWSIANEMDRGSRRGGGGFGGWGGGSGGGWGGGDGGFSGGGGSFGGGGASGSW